jgi:hypothetical protein
MSFNNDPDDGAFYVKRYTGLVRGTYDSLRIIVNYEITGSGVYDHEDELPIYTSASWRADTTEVWGTLEGYFWGRNPIPADQNGSFVDTSITSLDSWGVSDSVRVYFGIGGYYRDADSPTLVTSYYEVAVKTGSGAWIYQERKWEYAYLMPRRMR